MRTLPGLAGVIGAVVLFAGPWAAGASSQGRVHEMIKGEVLKVVDGDTLHFFPVDAPEDEEGQVEVLKVRMLGIDTPETHLTAPGGVYSQGYWGEAAHQYLEEIVPVGSQVTVMSFGKDHHGRVLGRIFKDKKDVNAEMVRSGWAVPYVICEGTDCNAEFFENHDVSYFLKLCREARQYGRGVFDPKKPLEEMPFEFRLRIQKREPDKFVGDYSRSTYVDPVDYPAIDLCKRIFFPSANDAKRVNYRYVDSGRE